MRYTNIPLAHTVIQHCKARGIQHIVISPGSRNAPLTLGFTADPYFRCYSIVDERSAGFFAMGMAQQLQKGVAVVCTSGSALLNYYPAVAEAFYSNIPLLVISADRPGYKIDIGDGQTIRQEDVFHRHLVHSAMLRQDVVHAPEAIRASGRSLPAGEADLRAWQLEIQRYNDSALNEALSGAHVLQGPVHINVPLEEPLYQLVDDPIVIPNVDGPPIEGPAPLGSLDHFGKIWAGTDRKMVIIGASPPGMLDAEHLRALAGDPSVLVFTETTSNCHHEEFFPSIDSIIAPIEKAADREQRFKELQPGLLITLGGMVVSKKIKAFLRQYRPEHHWHIGPKNAYDTYYSLTQHFKATPGTFFKAFSPYLEGRESAYHPTWAALRERYRERRADYLGKIEFSDLLAFYHIQDRIPHGYQLQLANSSTVRYSQLFELHPSIKVFCNRGTSGIDGSTSTAIGASLVEKHPTLLVTGDLSLFYDSNGLWNNYLRPDFRIIVMNNQGGGIFRILPGKEDSENFETFFETIQDLDISKLCGLFGVEHYMASDEKGLLDILEDFYSPSAAPRLLEVRTPRLVNNKILLTYFDFLS